MTIIITATKKVHLLTDCNSRLISRDEQKKASTFVFPFETINAPFECFFPTKEKFAHLSRGRLHDSRAFTDTRFRQNSIDDENAPNSTGSRMKNRENIKIISRFLFYRFFNLRPLPTLKSRTGFRGPGSDDELRVTHFSSRIPLAHDVLLLLLFVVFFFFC